MWTASCLEVLVDLRRQLARGREDERARRAARLRHEPVEDREDERGGLAAARHRAGEDVAAFHRGRDGVVLDGRRAREAHLLDAAEEVGVEAERGERHEGENRFPGRLVDAHVSPVEFPAGQGTMDRRWGHRTNAGGRFLTTRSTPGPVGFGAGTRERARQPKGRIARRGRRVKRDAFGAYGPRTRRRPRAGSTAAAARVRGAGRSRPTRATRAAGRRESAPAGPKEPRPPRPRASRP